MPWENEKIWVERIKKVMSQIHSHDRVLHACTCTWHFIQVISYQFGRYLFEYYLRHKDDKTCGDWQHKNGLARWGAKFHGNTTQHNKDAALRWWPRHSSFCYSRHPTISRNKRYVIVWYNVSLNQSYKAIPLPSTGKMMTAMPIAWRAMQERAMRTRPPCNNSSHYNRDQMSEMKGM